MISKVKTNFAVANHGGAMEFRDHFKNGAQPKSLISRRNKYNLMFIYEMQ